MTGSSQRQDPSEHQDALFERPTPEAPGTDAAMLALNACVRDGERMERDKLLADAARELGHRKLTRKVRPVSTRPEEPPNGTSGRSRSYSLLGLCMGTRAGNKTISSAL